MGWWVKLKTIAKRLFGFGRPLIALALGVIGLGGISDDLETWSGWIDWIVNHPTVALMAEKAVNIAEFINQWPVRVALVIAGLLVLIWPLRWFWRFRHKLLFRWRRLLAEQVWISREDALEVIRQSHWGRLKEPHVTRSINVLESFTKTLNRDVTVQGLTDEQKAFIKYDAFLDRTIDSFCEVNPTACRVNDEKEKEIDEVPLRRFLNKALDAELGDTFGEIPKYKVS